jgi:hypothetical protein
MSPRESASSELFSSEDFDDDDASGAFQARKRLALEKYGYKDRFMLSNDDDISDITTIDDDLSDRTTTSTCSAKKKGRTTSSSVRFSTVSVRSFDRIVGDHPCCHEGPALSLDWEYCELPEVSVDMYEATKKPKRRNKLFPWERREILSCWRSEKIQVQTKHARGQNVFSNIRKLFCHKS